VKKIIVSALAGILLLACVTTTVEAGEGRGGFMGFIAGCCFGLRAGADYNDGKEIHWREWCRLIPCVGMIFGIWDGVDGASGVTRSELAAKYGAIFY